MVNQIKEDILKAVDQMTLNENNSKPVPPDHNDREKLIDTHLGDYPEKLAKKKM